MSTKKTVLLIADVKNWAFDSIAQYLKKLLEDIYNIHILYSQSYSNSGELLKEIIKFPRVDFVHFFSRKDLRLLINYIATEKISNKLIDKFLATTVVTGVPDHLYLQKSKDITNYKNTFQFVDNYYTTSKILNDLYSDISTFPTPWPEVIYDNVLTDYNNRPNFDNHKKLRITWIGNSAWGEWYFGRNYDAKGYYTVIEPTFELLTNQVDCEINIANGAKQKRSKKEIFEILKNTDILLIAANTDGTPLPLIEAMSMGCAVITTNTGIV
jgi:glycosyltransferase involved in cell wall biosynthesis